MKKYVLPAIAFTLAVAVLTLLAPAAHAGNPTPRASHAQSTTDSYYVVKIIDENKTDANKVEYKVVASKQYKDEEKRIKDDYAQKLKEWQDVKKADATAPRPVRPIIKKIGSAYKTQTGAQKVADKLKDEEAGKDTGEDKTKDAKK